MGYHSCLACGGVVGDSVKVCIHCSAPQSPDDKVHAERTIAQMIAHPSPLGFLHSLLLARGTCVDCGNAPLLPIIDEASLAIRYQDAIVVSLDAILKAHYTCTSCGAAFIRPRCSKHRENEATFFGIARGEWVLGCSHRCSWSRCEECGVAAHDVSANPLGGRFTSRHRDESYCWWLRYFMTTVYRPARAKVEAELEAIRQLAAMESDARRDQQSTENARELRARGCCTQCGARLSWWRRRRRSEFCRNCEMDAR